MTPRHPRPVVLTGGPGGGKTTLIEELRHDPEWSDRVLALPEAIQVAGRVGISPRERHFQLLMVRVQMALEDALLSTLQPDDRRIVLCHRGSLDPLAYWLQRGWDEAGFFALTGTTRARHYSRYAGVIHLVTAADGAPAAYRRWPESHRPETAEEPIALDRALASAWRDHPGYCRLDNLSRGWAAKADAARDALRRILGRAE